MVVTFDFSNVCILEYQTFLTGFYESNKWASCYFLSIKHNLEPHTAIRPSLYIKHYRLKPDLSIFLCCREFVPVPHDRVYPQCPGSGSYSPQPGEDGLNTEVGEERHNEFEL